MTTHPLTRPLSTEPPLGPPDTTTAECELCGDEFAPSAPDTLEESSPRLTHCERCARLFDADVAALRELIVDLRDEVTALHCRVLRLVWRLREYGEHETDMVTR